MPQRICIGCRTLFPMDTSGSQRCPDCRTSHEQARGSRQARGYDRGHELARAQALAQFEPGQPCAIGGEPLRGDPALLDLAHNTDRTGWRGLACRRCNRGHADA